MKHPGLIDLSLILILASTAKGENWIINIPKRNINATSGKDVIIQCNYTYPSKYHSDEVYWKKEGLKSVFDTNDIDQNAFIFHPNDTFVLEKYRKRTELIGDKHKGSCSLKIKNVTENEQNIYVRIFVKGEKWSYKEHKVSISLLGIFADNTSILPTIKSDTMNMTEEISTTNYTAIFVPVAALLTITVVVGIVFSVKHKRSQTLIRQDSGYYANFRRPSSQQANREANCKKQDKLPEPKAIDEPVYLKAIDEPVYINTEDPSYQMDQSTDQTENVYANVDYSK